MKVADLSEAELRHRGITSVMGKLVQGTKEMETEVRALIRNAVDFVVVITEVQLHLKEARGLSRPPPYKKALEYLREHMPKDPFGKPIIYPTNQCAKFYFEVGCRLHLWARKKYELRISAGKLRLYKSFYKAMSKFAEYPLHPITKQPLTFLSCAFGGTQVFRWRLNRLVKEHERVLEEYGPWVLGQTWYNLCRASDRSRCGKAFEEALKEAITEHADKIPR